MPIYDYRCTNGHRFEVLQKIADEPVTECEVCGAPAVRVLHPVAIHFKGSGFYSTDYGRGKKSASAERAEAAGEGKSKDGDSKTSETKKSSDTESKPSSSEPKKAAEG
jgi:putative FmdB family regulatory protein